MTEAVRTTIGLAACLPLIPLRKIVNGGIMRRKRLFRTVVLFVGPVSPVFSELSRAGKGEMARYFQYIDVKQKKTEKSQKREGL